MKILGEYLTPCYLLSGISKSSTNIHNTVITRAQGRTEKVQDVCYPETEETALKTELEMLICDAEQLQK